MSFVQKSPQTQALSSVWQDVQGDCCQADAAHLGGSKGPCDIRDGFVFFLLSLAVPITQKCALQVEKKFTSSWKFPNTTIPVIQRIYKIIENKAFLQPYDKYKCVFFVQFLISRTKFINRKTVGNEVFRYHGTTRKCTLGAPGNTKLCSDTTCALCSILKTSFKTSLANPRGA